jgi:hypothetical protein
MTLNGSNDLTVNGNSRNNRNSRNNGNNRNNDNRNNGNNGNNRNSVNNGPHPVIIANANGSALTKF